MANPVDESKSDGLEILSIGALYTGHWDKKYWSSSRGKDRYPYPVGYQALRTHKGLTYKMEIHEGSKGPIFQITSNDKQFGSGETPDRAWENFQKKSLSRIKLWHGKRSSGKVDGVEFFGFKNALVQRLLRELVATIHDASDQSSVITNCNEASSIVPDVGNLKTHNNPDLRSCLEKTTVTGKRSRTSRGIDTKAVCKRGQERCHRPHQGNEAKALHSAPGKMDIDESLISCAPSDNHSYGDLHVLPNIELGKNVLLKASGMPVKFHEVSGDPKAEPCLIQVQRELPSMETCTAVSSLGADMPQKEKPEEIHNVSQLDIQCVEEQGNGLPVVTEEGSQKVQNLSDLLEPRSPLLQGLQDNVGDLIVPDTYDVQQEITCAPNFGGRGEKQSNANEPVSNLVLSEDIRTGTHSEEGSYSLNDNSEKSDFDSVDEDMSKSMMSLLLPLAIPLLTYSSRKRRRKSKTPKDLPCLPKLENNFNGAIPSADIKSPAGTLICSGSNGHIKAHLPSASVDPGLSVMGNVSYIVPDSLDNDQYEDHVANKLLPSDNAKAVAANLQKEKHEPIKGSSRVLDATESSSHRNETTGYKYPRYVVPDSLDGDQYEEFLANELPQFDNAGADEANLQKKKHKPDTKGSSPVLEVTESGAHQNETIRIQKKPRCVVPDSLDCDQPEDLEANALPTSDNAELVAAKLQKEKHEPYIKGSSPVLGVAELSSRKNETTGFQEDLRYIVPDSLDNDQYEDCVANELPPSDNAEAVAANLLKENHEPDKKGPRSISVLGKQRCSLGKTLPKMGKYGAPLSESIICRDIPENSVPEIHHRSENLVLHKVSEFGDSDICKNSFGGGRLGGQNPNLQNGDVEDALGQNCILQDRALSSTFNKDDIPFIDGCNAYLRNSKAYVDKDKNRNQHFDSVCQSPDQGRSSSQNCALHIKEDEAEIHTICQDKHELNDEIEGTMNLIGCYSHPLRISSVMLTRKLHEIYICVSCGLLEERKRDLFLYKLSTIEPSRGSPCMVGHTSMIMPSLKDDFGRDVTVDKSGMQFTPDARGLVLADSIRMPYCRSKNLHCLCPQCESCCFEENAVKIVQIKLGYVSLVVKLKTMFPVHCVLVCEPEHLVAVDESGRIYIWILNSTWSVQTEAYVIPSYDYLPSRVVELKRIPKSASMVVGHNGYGEFSLWDIIKRTLVSWFSAPGSSVIDFLPVSLFNWLSKDLSHDKVIMEACVRKLEEATMSWFSRHSKANISCSRKGEETAVWLLVCTSSDSPAQSACYPRNHHLNSDGCWRLGLLIKDTVIFGGALYTSTAAIGTSSGTGIIGTHGGQVYVWELATGSKLEVLHDLEGDEVLHIATDDSTSPVVAIAGGGGQLCVYLRT